MYDPLDTQISFLELKSLLSKAREKNVKAGILGGWAAYLYVNETYRLAFGKDYMESRDIDLFVDPDCEAAFAEIIKEQGFVENGLPFRYEKIYNREIKKFVPQHDAKSQEIFNLVYIFLDLFSNRQTTRIKTWWDLPPLKNARVFQAGEFTLVDIDTLVDLKCFALFARDRADKETKDACDLYALLQYCNQKPEPTKLLTEAIKKLLNRNDLQRAIAEHVLLDPVKAGIVHLTLADAFEKYKKQLGLN